MEGWEELLYVAPEFIRGVKRLTTFLWGWDKTPGLKARVTEE
jgi:hypothetical protein